jgi:perosamine synthetase
MMSNRFIPLANPDIQEQDIQAVVEVLRSGMLVQAKNIEQLENYICEFVGCSYAAAVSNGTATMHIALHLLGIGKGDEVIIPSFSYIATANVVELVGAKPVFVDINIETFCIDTTQIEAAITSRTKAIMPVHEFGLAADMIPIMALAKKYNLYVVEDAACALGAMDNGQFTGTFGDMSSFSLHPRKAITSGEGGIITTNNSSFIEKIKTLRNHGAGIINGKVEFVVPGFNYRMTDFQAALVLSQFKRLRETLAYKQKLADIYFEEIKNKDILLPRVPTTKKHSWQTFHIVLPDGMSQYSTIDTLRQKGIGTNYGAQCMPHQHYYKQKYAFDCAALFPNGLRANLQGLALPIYEKMSFDDVRYVASVVNSL